MSSILKLLWKEYQQQNHNIANYIYKISYPERLLQINKSCSFQPWLLVLLTTWQFLLSHTHTEWISTNSTTRAFFPIQRTHDPPSHYRPATEDRHTRTHDPPSHYRPATEDQHTRAGYIAPCVYYQTKLHCLINLLFKRYQWAPVFRPQTEWLIQGEEMQPLQNIDSKIKSKMHLQTNEQYSTTEKPFK